MRIVHLCLGNYFADGYSYQENMLTKFHKQDGHEVYVIASLQTYDANGKVTFMEMKEPYLTEHGVEVTRIPYKKDNKLCRKIRIFKGLYEALESKHPEVLFIHNCQFADMKKVVRYLKAHPEVKVYCDSHADYSNSATNWFSKNILHKFLWRRSAKLIEPFATKFYGVLPARVKFLQELYKLPPEKCELLVMGADDECVEAALHPDIRQRIRSEFNLDEKDYVVITGGKIDHNKPQTLELMEAVNETDDPSFKLLVFGSVVPELRQRFDELISDRVIYIGWKKSEEIYNYFAAADLIAFPGLHSVLWEQAVAMGKPCAFRKIDGFQHIDLDGNCVYFEEDSVEAYKKVLVNAKPLSSDMQKIAMEKGMKVFSYKKIAKKALEE